MEKIMKSDSWLFSYYDMMSSEDKVKKIKKVPKSSKPVLSVYSGSIDTQDLKNMTPEQFFKQELTVAKPDFGGKYDPKNMNHVRILTEYQDQLEQIEVKKRTIYKDFLLQKPEEKNTETSPEKIQKSDFVKTFLEDLKSADFPENVELKLNKKISKSELIGLKSQIKHTTSELQKMNEILDQYKLLKETQKKL